jgi:hypothetical protein
MVRVAAGGGLWSARPGAASPPAGRIQSIEYKGVLVKDCTVAGETRSDDVTPAHPNGIPVSRDKWLVIYATRSFRGVDDDRSIVYQLRHGAPDGRVIREGLLVRSRSDWDPLGDGRTCIMQHGHPVAFGVPKGALIGGKPAPSANVFVAKWRKCARLYDKNRNYVEHGSKDPELERRTQTVEWVQFRLNPAEDDIEIIQPVAVLRQHGFASGRAISSAPVRHMNQSFVQAVPYTRDGTEWSDCNHFDGGRIAALRYRFDAKSGKYEWVETGHLLGGRGAEVAEASLARYGKKWIFAARTARGPAWTMAEDPFAASIPPLVHLAEPPTTSPMTAYTGADGVLRLYTGDPAVSPYKNARNPLYAWAVDPENDFRASERTLIFDSHQAGLPIRKEASPKIDMCKLLPHNGGREQYLAYRVSIRAFNFPYVGSGGLVAGIPLANAEEKGACAIYYSKIHYAEALPGFWEYARK